MILFILTDVYAVTVEIYCTPSISSSCYFLCYIYMFQLFLFSFFVMFAFYSTYPDELCCFPFCKFPSYVFSMYVYILFFFLSTVFLIIILLLHIRITVSGHCQSTYCLTTPS